MTSHTLSQPAQERIDQYHHFTLGNTSCPVLYFNNKTQGARAALAVYVGKGTPQDISQELTTILFKRKISLDALTPEQAQRLMYEEHIGIDCSGFVYHVLDAESIARGFGHIHTHLSFSHRRGIFGRIATYMHPEKNASVAVFADDANSSVVAIHDVAPGDIITMTGNMNAPERDHILLIHAVESDESGSPLRIHYSHSVAYPEDGLYDTGVRQGTISFDTSHTPLLEATWTESRPAQVPNRTLLKATSSKTEIRRIHWK